MTPEAFKLLAASGGIALIAIILGVAIGGWRRLRRPLPEFQIAVISEKIVYSFGGILALSFLLLANAAAFYVWLTDMSVISETALAVMWIVGNILGSVGIIVGRRRIYSVYRMPSSDVPPSTG